MKFLNADHEKKYAELTAKIHANDKERCVAMFILSGDCGLYSKASRLYDFKKNQFIFDLESDEFGVDRIVWKVDMSSSEAKLALLALALYSGQNHIGVVELFRCLDKKNRCLGIQAITEFYVY